MLILQQYIQEVLFRQRICVVPHIGTFSIQHFPSRYNAGAQTLLPPRDQVVFTQSWQDDGSCQEWIALKENLVPAVAQRKLDKYIEEFKEALQPGQVLELPGIGKLQGDFAGNLHFHAEELPVDPTDLPITPIQREEPSAPSALPPAIAPTTAMTPVEPPVPPSPAAVEPVMTLEEEDTLEAVTEGSIFKWWWAAAGALILLGGLAAWWYIGRQGTPATPSPVVIIDTTRHAAPADTSLAVTPAATDSISYFVVLEEFQDSLSAAKKAVKRQGWKQNVVMYRRDNLYKVAVPVRSLPIDTTSELQENRSKFGINKAYLEY
ncbi:hypothetical protein HHL17_11195 [Chitinophaga sp. G-6-1-13]|uniref:CCDC81-like prokaryotic HU domain-containing protein n=1 Tax=Chitinophaga fulva TaxID=2728842 RepID=A0A848GK30_9BACT|nr:hypothetical protein [Chitinophaga fulva]NML37759.1 hypothetical protein [Chitinophaga fulva]